MSTTATTCCCCSPRYAMYRFYAQVAGASIREIPLSRREAGLPARRAAAGDPADNARHPDRESEQSHGDRNVARGHRAHSRQGRRRRGSGRRSVLRILRRHRAAAAQRLSEPVRQPHVFESLRHGRDAPRLPVLAIRQRRVSAQGAVAVQREQRGGAGGARRDPGSHVHREIRDRSSGRRASCCTSDSRSSASSITRARRTSCCSRPAAARFRFATSCAGAACWCATAVTKSPAACASPWARAIRSGTFLGELEQIW